MEIHTALLDRLRRALATEQAISTGLPQQIVDATRHHSVLSTQAHEARRAADRFPYEAPPTGTSRDEWQERLSRLDQARAEEERALRRLVRDPAVCNPERALAEFAAHRQPDAEHFHAAAAAAAEAVQRAAEALRRLEAERGTHGKRAGLLRATLQEAERFLASHGLTVEEAA